MRNREIDRIYDWSVQQKGSYDYPQMDKNAKSYFDLHEGDTYIKEYGGKETIAEVRMELECIWSGDACMEKIIMPVAISIMKGKPNHWETKADVKNLDDYIYIF
uniref:Uncharacterized protein n=1 Tax=Eubacterium plexicaudatum ASF492 TaxID=1235802 RepID=N2AXH5_9FIRM